MSIELMKRHQYYLLLVAEDLLVNAVLQVRGGLYKVAKGWPEPHLFTC